MGRKAAAAGEARSEERVDERAEAEHLSASEVIRKALRTYLDVA